MAGVDIRTRRKEGALLVEIRGKIGISETPMLREALEELFAEQAHMVINLANIVYIDSSCLGALITIRKELEKRGHRLLLAEPSDIVRDVLNLTRLENFFQVSETEEEALQQLRSG